MRVLNIFDLGSFIHAGAWNTHAYIEDEPIAGADGYRSCRIPCGGVAQVIRTVRESGTDATYVMVADRNPTIKKGMYPDYKAQREHKRNIEIQKELTEFILADCGFTVLAAEGYEADDIIYSLVTKFKGAYDQVNVFTGDSDLYFLVDKNVSIRKSSSRAKDVDINNFEEATKNHLPYNTITLSKIINGDTSDNIAGLSKEVRAKIRALPKEPAFLATLGKKEVLMSLGYAYGQEYIDQLNLIYPLTVEVPNELIPQVDYRRMTAWGKTIHCSAFGTSYSTVPEILRASVDEIIARGLYED